jgi:acyl-CoA dehydrogenase
MTVVGEVDRDLVTLVEEVLATAGRSGGWACELDRDLWDRAGALGLTTLLSQQGAGWAEVAAVLGAAARRGTALPVVEHDVLAGWLLHASDSTAEVQSGGLVVPAVLDDDGSAACVPWAPRAERLALLARDGQVHVVTPAEAVVAESTDLAGRPCGDVRLPTGGGFGLAPPPQAAEVLQWRHRLARCVEITGAMAGAVELAVRYSGERVQFGRPVAAFQAVQHLLADAAAEQALSEAATRAAVALADREEPESPALARAVTVAACVASRGLGIVARGTHQVLGAMGTTVEHPLQAVLRPALAWRAELGSTVALERALAQSASAHPGSVWEWLSA